MSIKILIIDPESSRQKNFWPEVAGETYEFLYASHSDQAMKVLTHHEIRIIVLDLAGLSSGQLDFISYVKVNFALCSIIVLADLPHLELATQSIRKGATLYLIKPAVAQDVRFVIGKTIQRQEKDQRYLESQLTLMKDLLGGEPAMARILRVAAKVAQTESTILIGGDSGTGKEVFARYIHMISKRNDGPFVVVNCGAIPENLVESELFGHVKGSFTGAAFDKKGLVEEASLGTLFLDEIGELSLNAQVKLLRFLQDFEDRRVGATTSRKVDVRLIAATNRDLAQAIKDKTFREDLFFRINVFQLHLPPLKERKENLKKLIPFFIIKHANRLERTPPTLSADALEVLMQYNYPGNIRELENILERALVLCEGGEIKHTDLSPDLLTKRPLLSFVQDGKVEAGLVTLSEVEKQHIAKVMAKVNHNQTEAAKVLDISRTTLWRKLKEYGLETGEDKS
jgi:DNA-binding NtrC family response regulator